MIPIPFEAQRTIDGRRTCGAAALTMVYRSLGTPCEQVEVWQRVAEEIRPGVKATRAHRLALDAGGRDFAAVTVQAEHPAELLACMTDTDARVILNHRVEATSQLGHYSVLLRFDGDEIELHDPHLGPNRVLPWGEFAELWCPTPGESEIVGHVAVAIGTSSTRRKPCLMCGHAPPQSLPCPHCKRPIPTGPAGVIRCTVKGCDECLWKRLYCPDCDWAIRP